MDTSGSKFIHLDFNTGVLNQGNISRKYMVQWYFLCIFVEHLVI